jgi:hypothetical protein
MNRTDLESRIVVLENEISSLKSKFDKIENIQPWWKSRVGLFQDDPSHAEAMKLGREWRENHRTNGDGGG